MKNPWYVFSSSSWQPHNLGQGGGPLFLRPSTQPQGLSAESLVFLFPSCKEVQQTQTQVPSTKVSFRWPVHSLPLRKGLTSENSSLKGQQPLARSVLHPLLWSEDQLQSQTRAGWWPLMRPGRKTAKRGPPHLGETSRAPGISSQKAGLQESVMAKSSS